MHDAKNRSPPTAPVYWNHTPALGGMEQTAPSFRDFMRTVPPSQAPQLKPLPPVPRTRQPSAVPYVPPHSSSLTSNARTSRSEGFLKTASTEWESDEEAPGERAPEPPNDFLQPATYTVSNPVLSKPDREDLPVLEPRKFELLIPDPSPQASPDMLTPAFEYETHMDFPPSPASSKPPQTPLPPIPSGISPAKLKDLSMLKKTPTPPSPAPSWDASVISPATALSEAPLAISPFSLATPVTSISRQWATVPQSPPWSRDFSQYVQQSASSSPHRLVARSAAPGADDEWEDMEETRRARGNRLSVDYHSVLVDQYRDLVSPSSDMFGDDKQETLWTPPQSPSTGDDDLIPLPLALKTEPTDRYAVIDRSSPFPEDHYEQPSPQHHRRKLSIREKIPALAAGTLNMILPSHHSRKSSTTSSRSGEIPISPPADHESFREVDPKPGPRPAPRYRARSRVFPVYTRPQSGIYAITRAKPVLKSVKKGKKGKKEEDQPKEPPLTLTLTSSLSTNTSSTRPSVERSRPTATSPTQMPASPSLSLFPTSSRPSPSTASTTSTKPPLSPRPSLSNNPSPSPPPPPRTKASNPAASTTKSPAPSPLARGLTHTELFSLSPRAPTPPPKPTTTKGNKAIPSYPRQLAAGPPPENSSHRRPKSSTARAALSALGIGSSSSTPRKSAPTSSDGARLLFVHEKPAPSLPHGAALPPPSSSTGQERLHRSASGALSSSSWVRGRETSLVKRAVEAHRAHRRERQKQEMKRSIRVLGQTDPQVVEGYVRVSSSLSSSSGVRPMFRGDGEGGAAVRGGGEGWL
ncbi:hypothetical protein GTA08_BOTSDO02655 [Botryosphaeria dothidea]|uniref:Uncharacterized protein n=1 Tax=Botryosphaeria dothidea TaxID=55169 RepID=A0A8H4IYL0_9PEZI|nr:hypothetical protein GTA08_BOTSDO02655 [Botryosphaeria dothidea]